MKSAILKMLVVVGLVALLVVAVGTSRGKDREERCKELVCKIVDKDKRPSVAFSMGATSCTVALASP